MPRPAGVVRPVVVVVVVRAIRLGMTLDIALTGRDVICPAVPHIS